MKKFCLIVVMKSHFVLVLLLLFGVTFVTSEGLSSETVAEEKTEASPVAETKESDPLSVEMQAIEDAHADVEAHINKPMWFLIGCMPGLGLMPAFLFSPEVPVGRLIGKSSEYTAFYTDAYKRQMQKQRFQLALGGCLTTGGAWLFLGVVGTSANLW